MPGGGDRAAMDARDAFSSLKQSLSLAGSSWDDSQYRRLCVAVDGLESDVALLETLASDCLSQSVLLSKMLAEDVG